MWFPLGSDRLDGGLPEGGGDAGQAAAGNGGQPGHQESRYVELITVLTPIQRESLTRSPCSSFPFTNSLTVYCSKNL